LGIVEVEAADRYRRGVALRDVRVRKRMLTQSQMAHWLRISPILLNDIEHGRCDWPVYIDRQRIREMYEDWAPYPALITAAEFLEIVSFEIAMIESVITSMALRPGLRSADSRLMADDTIACFLELRAYRNRNW
jgi:DNA-binding XRE family transcriptional regulator